MKELIIATNNEGKVKEFQNIFSEKGYTVRSLKDFPEIDDVEETGTTFEENALLKAQTVAKALKVVVIADDSGLEVDALNGEPGVYSARYAGTDKNDEANIDKVLEKLQEVPEEKRTARFVCVLAVAMPDGESLTVRGTCEGFIANERKGENGFGYDPIFYIKEIDKTMAQLSKEEKNKISHRARAIELLAKRWEKL
ncbi:MAG: XTP/dITP diphosphatase [Bacillaceae bacterium]|nr:XTP/dITP diphosphatase [Bacillaceae bacterium]